MKTRLALWLNSVQAHMILLVLGTVAALTAANVALVALAEPPPRSPVSVYEMARMVRGLEVVEPPAGTVAGFSASAPQPEGEAERLVSNLLAAHLGMKPGDVTVRLGADRELASAMRKELQLYGARADPVISDSFAIFVRRDPATWLTFTRIVRPSTLGYTLHFWRHGIYFIGILIVLPLAMVFSVRISRPVGTFAEAADRMGAGVDDSPVPVTGPTEIRQAAVALNEMQQRIAQFVRERIALVGAIAHDLRTPLSNLRFRIADMEPERRAAAEAEIRQMEQLISSTLDYVDSEGRPMEAEPLDFGSLLQTIVDDARDRGARIAFSPPEEKLTVDGDLIRLKRLFSNLVENGLKFGEVVQIACSREGEDVVVDIVDDGPGMPEQDLARAFDPFFRGERSRNRSTGGIGLGLSIADSAVRAHGGTIELANLDPGFRARVTMPLQGAGSPLADGASTLVR